jgi:cytidylate kinase
MAIITISRLLGAGETTIVPAIAERLGWQVADQSVVRREAELTGMSLPDAVFWDERDPGFHDRFHKSGASIAAFVDASREVMQQLATEGNVVVVGRGGNLLLRDWANALHVRLIADMPFRVRRVMEARWVTDKAAADLIAESDRKRNAYFRHVFHVDWNDPSLYDIVLKTDRVGIESAVDIIEAAAAAMTV